jgi:DHA1 family bicyclomycin/chloramphenicol resistance-like MFS transporter
MSNAKLGSTLTVFFVVFAFSTLFAGPLSDRYGRKAIIIGGFIIFILGSLFCAITDSTLLFFAGRILQAAGASCIPVAGRAMIRDMCSDIQVIEVLGWMAAIGGLIPIVAPMLGGVINDTLGWRYNFWFLTLFSIVAGLIILIKLPHSMKAENRQPLHISSIFKTYKDMIKAPEFIVVISPLMLAFAIQGAYMETSPFIFMKKFGLSAIEYGIANIAIVVSMIIGRYLAVGLTKRFSSYVAYSTGAYLPFLGGVFLVLILYFDIANILTVLISISIAVTGFGILLPIGVKSIMTAFRDRAGAVSALHGFLTMGMVSVGSFTTVIIKHKMHINSLSSLAFFTIIVGIIIIFSGIMTKKYLH